MDYDIKKHRQTNRKKIVTSEQQYLDLLKNVLSNGVKKPNRTGTDALTILGAQCRYNLQEGFPLFTTKKVWFKGVKHELLWFIKGDTNIKYLVDNGVNIWNQDAYRHYMQEIKRLRRFNRVTEYSKERFIERIKEGDANLGDLGPVYGAQWRAWNASYVDRQTYPDEMHYVDQLANLIDGLKNNPMSRQHILSAWNVGELDKMALPPCHVMSMWTVMDNKLTCHMVQRSCDLPLGVPFNIASYSILTHMIAQIVGLDAGDFIWTGHDIHIYVNQIDGVKKQLERNPYALPKLWLNPDIKDIDNFCYDDIKILDYKCHPKIDITLST